MDWTDVMAVVIVGVLGAVAICWVVYVVAARWGRRNGAHRVGGSPGVRRRTGRAR